jgi:hypothetical protein
VTRRGPTPEAAMQAAFQAAQREVHAVRAAPRLSTSVGMAQETCVVPMAVAATAR